MSNKPSWFYRIRYHDSYDKIRNKWIRRLYLGLLKFAEKTKLLKKRPILAGITPYGGAQWWSLTHESVRFICQYAKDNLAFCDFYATTRVPDEMFFQTILLNSHLKEKVACYEDYHNWSFSTSCEDNKLDNKMFDEPSSNMRYIDWNVRRGGRASPVILDKRDQDALKTSPCLFARKFDEHVSSELLNFIENELL